MLVSAAILAVLIGLLLPALGKTRTSAESASCLAMQHEIAVSLLTYAARNDEWIPGFNTSGRALWGAPSEGVVRSLYRVPSSPVQVNDWLSPVLDHAGLPRNRDHRFYELMERWGCRSMKQRVPVWTGGGDEGNVRLAAWIDSKQSEPIRGLSFLMPTNFQLFGGQRSDHIITQGSSSRLALLERVHRLPPRYRPRVDLVGSASRKICFADGFRYLDRWVTDIDASYSHSNWGAFSERSTCDPDSRSWGRRGGGGPGGNIPLVYRHSGEMSASFWDGHAESLSIKQSRNPVYWAPTGSMVRIGLTYEPDAMTFGYDPSNHDRRVIE